MDKLDINNEIDEVVERCSAEKVKSLVAEVNDLNRKVYSLSVLVQKAYISGGSEFAPEDVVRWSWQESAERDELHRILT